MKSAVKSRNILIDGKLIPASLIIEDGKIHEVTNYDTLFSFDTEDFSELVVLPGIIDPHVHINEPGREHWEGFETATKAAAAGGVTMFVDMPLNSSPVTVNKDAFEEKIQSAKNKIYVDCGFYAGLIPSNINELEGLIERGVLGVKAFMIHSGLDEFPNVGKDDLMKAARIIRKYDIPLLVHAEIDCGFKQSNNYDKCSFNSFVETRPKKWENEAIKILIDVCRKTNCRIHIVHLSSSEAIELIKDAKKEGLPLTVETCPHYLSFSSEEVKDKDTRFKCTPPIRESSNREMLWTAIKNGVIDFIASDHSPCNPELKCMDEGNFEKAWGGISGLQFSLPVVLSEAVKRGLSIPDVSKLMSENTAKFIGLGNKKGKIEKDYDADLVAVNTHKKFLVEEKNIFHKHKVTPYSGKELNGVVEMTYLRGKKIFERGKIINKPSGEIILKSEEKSLLDIKVEWLSS